MHSLVAEGDVDLRKSEDGPSKQERDRRDPSGRELQHTGEKYYVPDIPVRVSFH
jgi:hypothetical protein